MSAYKTQQHRLVHRGQTFHLVSYAGQPADESRHQPEVPPSWYLMLSGKRWVVGPQVGEPTAAELDLRFGEWLDAHVFGDAPAGEGRQPPAEAAARRAGLAEDLPAAIPLSGAQPRGRGAV